MGGFVWKMVGGKVSIYDRFDGFIHYIVLSDDEQKHVNSGGKLVIVHACGTEVHVKLPRLN